MPALYSSLGGGTVGGGGARDSLELASLASSSIARDGGGEAGGLRQRGDADDDASSRPSISSSRKASLERDDPLGDGDFDDDPRRSDDSGDGSRRPGGGFRSRTFSMSSTFDFAANLFPLSSTAAGGGYAPLGTLDGSASGRGGGRAGGRGATGAPGGGLPGTRGVLGGSLEKHKTLTYLNGLSLIVGLIIGSGIFSSPSQVNSKVGSPGASLIVWTIAGVLAWTGAASYAELGGAIPLNGGAQVYLAKILGEVAGFLFTWVAVLVLKPGGAAIIAIIMGEYLVRAVIGAEAETVNPWINKAVALAGLCLVTFLNAISTRVGTRINDMFMFLKFVALIGVTVTGIVVAATGFSFNGSASRDWKTHEWFEGTSTDLGAWAVALYAGLWAYDGWDNVSSETCQSTVACPPRIHIDPLATDELCRGRIPQPQPGPPARHPHGDAARHHLLPDGERVVLPCATACHD